MGQHQLPAARLEDDVVPALRVLMGKRCAREAVDAAERYLRTSLVTYVREQAERPQLSGKIRPGPPVDRRSARQ
ncbi:DUF5133 domain-containing protein [Streptomyces sp. NPDC005921]